MRLQLVHPDVDRQHDKARAMASVCSYPASDRDVFLSGYAELCRGELRSATALEICSGEGRLAVEFAKLFPETRVYALDLFVPARFSGVDAERPPSNLEFLSGSAFDLGVFPDESVDLIWGQAALHHLASNPDALCAEVLRVLKPGGRLVFVFEPLGHNLLVAAVRAMRVSLVEETDESNLFLSQIERMGNRFSSCTVESFNLLAYPMKALADRLSFICQTARAADSALFRALPALRRYGANCNIIFRK